MLTLTIYRAGRTWYGRRRYGVHLKADSGRPFAKYAKDGYSGYSVNEAALIILDVVEANSRAGGELRIIDER